MQLTTYSVSDSVRARGGPALRKTRPSAATLGRAYSAAWGSCLCVCVVGVWLVCVCVGWWGWGLVDGVLVVGVFLVCVCGFGGGWVGWMDEE